MPDRKPSSARPGKFAIRVAAFFLLIALLVLYPSTRVDRCTFDHAAGLAARIGFALDLPACIVGLDADDPGTEWSPQLQLRKEHHLVTSGPYPECATRSIRPCSAWDSLCSGNCQLDLLCCCGGDDCRHGGPCSREERMMLEKVREEYRAYMQRPAGSSRNNIGAGALVEESGLVVVECEAAPQTTNYLTNFAGNVQ